MNREPELKRVERQAYVAQCRLRINDALRVVARGLPALLVFAAGALGASKLFTPSAGWLRMLWALAGVGLLLLVAAVVRVVARRRPWQLGALALDRHHSLSDRLTSALEFQRVPADAQSPFMHMVITEAAGFASDLNPKRAVPLVFSRDFAYSLALLAVVLVLAVLTPSKPPVQAVASAPEVIPFVAEVDDLQLMRELAEQWRSNNTSAAARDAAQRFNQLVEDIAERRLDRDQVMAQLEQLQRQLAPLDVDQTAGLQEGLQGIARALQTSPDARAVANALGGASLPDAEKALRELAEKLKNKTPLDRGKLEELRKALQAAAQESSGRLERLEKERQQAEAERERLLKKRRNELSAGEQAELGRQERRLERLNREQRRAQAGKQQLSELDRQLAEAARQLLEQMGQGAEHLQAGADELGRMAQRQLSEQEKEQLKKQLEELREMLRRQQGAGEDQRARLRDFARRARGGDASGQAPGKALGLGAGQQSALLPLGGGSGAGQVPSPASQAGNAPGSGEQAGSSTNAQLRGKASTLPSEMQDVSAAGIDSGEGPSASSLVYGAAQRGFVGGGYKRVYSEYKTVAEETLERDRIPAGYEQHVRRYFQLIRPRD